MSTTSTRGSVSDRSKLSSNKDSANSQPQLKKKVLLSAVTLPPLSPEQHSLTAVKSKSSQRSPSRNVTSDKSLSLLEIRFQMKAEKALTQADLLKEPLLLASSSGTLKAFRSPQLKEASGHKEILDPVETSTPLNKSPKADKKATELEKEDEKATKPGKGPRTSDDVLEIFAQKTPRADSDDFTFYYLKEMNKEPYRPYELKVVNSDETGCEHYIFSPYTVLHVTKTGFGGLVSTADWHRERVFWTALQKIAFFRRFRLYKAFAWWQRNVHMIRFHRRSHSLQDNLLLVVPQFRNALHLFTRIIEELKETNWMPVNDSRTYTLPEFRIEITKKKEGCIHILKKLAQYHVAILKQVKEESYKAIKKYQLLVRLSRRPNKTSEPIYQHLAHRQDMKRELEKSESAFQKLGNFSKLLNQMIEQSVLTVIQTNVTSFLSWLKRTTSVKTCLFSTVLHLTENSNLTVDPPVSDIQNIVRETLLTAGHAFVQMCESCGFFQEMTTSACNSDLPDDNQLVLSGETVAGNMVPCCYYPLSKTQLEWQIDANDITMQIADEQAELMQAAEEDIEMMCQNHCFLESIHLFLRQWSPASLESMKGQQASEYDECICELRSWAERVNSVHPTTFTSNHLFHVDCTATKQILGQQLTIVEQQIADLLFEEIKHRTESLILVLENIVSELKNEPQILEGFPQYAHTVKETAKILTDLERSLQYNLSLRYSISKNFRKMTKQEKALEAKLLDVWNSFIHFSRTADRLVKKKLPMMANALETTFAFLTCELRTTVLKATTGPFLDKSQDAEEIVPILNYICAHVRELEEELRQLKKNSESIQSQTINLSDIEADILKVMARRDLWQLKAESATWVEKWKRLPFTEVLVSECLENIAKWKNQAQILTNDIVMEDAVLQETLKFLEDVYHQVTFIVKLHSSKLRPKHWQAFYYGLNLKDSPEKHLTVSKVLDQELEAHQKLIDKICKDAITEWNMEQIFKRICKRWEKRTFKLCEFHIRTQLDVVVQKEELISSMFSANVEEDNRFIITGIVSLYAKAENDLITLSTILTSVQHVEFASELEDWIQSLQDFMKLLDLLEKYQEMWTFLIRTFDETSCCVQNPNLGKLFNTVDKTFKELILSISDDTSVLNFVSRNTESRFCGNNLCLIFTDGLSTMEVIYNQLMDVIHTLCEQFPRLWFLSHKEVMQLLSFHLTPITIQFFVHKCFRGVRFLEVETDLMCYIDDTLKCDISNERNMRVFRLTGSQQEQIIFDPYFDLNPDSLVWLETLEEHLKLTMINLMKQCTTVRNQFKSIIQDPDCVKIVRGMPPYYADSIKDVYPELTLLSNYPLQCWLFVEEALWCNVVQQAFHEKSPVTFEKIKVYNSRKLKNLVGLIRTGVKGSKEEFLLTKYTMMCMSALVQITMNHVNQLSKLMELPCSLESSFEWLSSMKHYINTENQNMEASEIPLCYVDILNHRFQYQYEYYGPEELVIIHSPSTDKALLGTLLALTNFKGSFVCGPPMSGKTQTLVQFGKALGQQVVVSACKQTTRPANIHQLIVGALKTGAWLLLSSVDLLTLNVQSILGQFLEDIYQSLSKLPRNKNLTPDVGLGYKNSERITDCTNFSDTESYIELSGKRILVKPSFGCILISSKKNTSAILESLRFTTRHVSLTCLDCRITVEIMLASIGFTESKSLSQRLVTLVSLAKDTKCLPDFLPDDHACIRRVLLKIIAASSVQLQEAVHRQEMSHEAKVLSSFQTNLMHGKNIGTKEAERLSKIHFSQLSVIWAIMEESALIKAIFLVLIPKHRRDSEFYTLFKTIFPLACQYPVIQQSIEEEEKIQLEDALKEELLQTHLYCDKEIVSNAVKLYQSMKVSQAVMLLGPTGSGKTTCHRALAGTLNRLFLKHTASAFKSENMIDTNIPPTGHQTFVSNWSPNNILVLFPNAMRHEELFGCFCENKGWKDGALTKVVGEGDLRNPELLTCELEGVTKSPVKWLVMDGEPIGRPGWLDHLTTLCTSQDADVYLSSSETIISQSNLKILMEVTDLQHASPSAMTHCTLVNFTGGDLWQSVWKSEITVLSSEHELDQRIVKMWNRLAEDLFYNTISSFEENGFLTANRFERGIVKRYGLQEIMSFFRILRALLQHFAAQLERQKEAPKTNIKGKTDYIDSQNKQELLCRNLFLGAYVWGFGGHLYVKHKAQFNLLARQMLFNCRYTIQVPEEESVFEYFLGFSTNMCVTDIPPSKSFISKHGQYKHLLSLMLAANQPILVVGEPGSGKTTLCNSLLSLDKPYIHLPGNPLLNARELRLILKSIHSWENCHDVIIRSIKRHPGLLLFVDDIHEAPHDVCDKASMALEALRQCITLGGIVVFETYFISLLSSRSVSFMATACTTDLANEYNNVISLRLSRLFSIFLHPSQSADTILSIHSEQLKLWLSGLPLDHKSKDIANSVITATKDLYQAVCHQFPPTVLRPFFRFSYHDLHKVFSGMLLVNIDIPPPEIEPKPEKFYSTFYPDLSVSPAPSLNIIHLWMHECMRTFSDRLSKADDKKAFLLLLFKTATTHFGQETHKDSSDVGSIGSYVPHENKSLICKTISQNVNIAKLCSELNQNSIVEESETDQSLTETSFDSENPASSKESLKTQLSESDILQHYEDLMTNLVYGPKSFESLKSLNKLRNIRDGCFYQEQNLSTLILDLRSLLNDFAKDKTERAKTFFDLTDKYFVHTKDVCQLLRILRVLFTPAGHGLLIGLERKTGRKSCVRLAAFLTGYHLMEVHPDNEKELRKLLSEARERALRSGVHVIILVHEDISLLTREHLLAVMSHRAYPAIYTDEEIKLLVYRVTALKHSKRYLMDKWKTENKIHVFLLMPVTTPENNEIPSKDETRILRKQMTKARGLCFCVEIYHPWSYRSLEEVAHTCLNICPYNIIKKFPKHGLTAAMAEIHLTACRYGSVILGSQCFDPPTYIKFISHFGHLCHQLHNYWETKNHRLSTALTRLELLNKSASQYHTYLLELQRKIAETKQQIEDSLHELEDLKILVSKTHRTYIEKQRVICNHDDKLSNAEEQIKPVFRTYVKIFECLNSSDYEEVRSYRDPPEGVVKIMDAVCLMFDRPLGWESAKQLLGQPNFFQELEYFDRGNMSKENFYLLREMIKSDHFIPRFAREVSRACESLCRWILAVYEGCCHDRNLVDLTKGNVLDKEARKDLHAARMHKRDTVQRYKDTDVKIKNLQKLLSDLLQEQSTAEEQEVVARRCAEQLKKPFDNWKKAFVEAQLHLKNIHGDSLLVAAITAYLNPFSHNTRTELLGKWRELFQTGIIDKNPNDIRASMFAHTNTRSTLLPPGFPINITEKFQLPIVQPLEVKMWEIGDSLSAQLIMALLQWSFTYSCVQRWPLLTDFEQYVDIKSQKQDITGEVFELKKELKFEMMICADDVDLLDKLDQAAEKGLKVLVTDLERVSPSSGLLAKLMLPSKSQFPWLQRPPRQINPEFCLFFSTHLPYVLLSSEIYDSILTRVDVVDLSLNSEGVKELLLTQLLKCECKDLLIQHMQCQYHNRIMQEKLAMIQETVLGLILQSDPILLKDKSFILYMSVYSKKMKKLEVEIEPLMVELEYQNALLVDPCLLMEPCASLYRALQKVYRFSPAYYFSLTAFITVMQEAFLVKGKLLVLQETGEENKTLLVEILNTMALKLLVHYRPRLFQSQNAALKVLVSLALLEFSKLCSGAEISVFLKGLEDIEDPEFCNALDNVSSCASLPFWVPHNSKPGIFCLEKMPIFTGIVSSICTNSFFWKEYFSLLTCTMAATVPCNSHSHLSLLQRALLWKTVFPNSLEQLVDTIVTSVLCLPIKTKCTRLTESSNTEVLSTYLIKNEKLVILTLPPQDNPKHVSVQPMHLVNQLAYSVAEKNKVRVKVTCVVALIDKQRILKMLENAVRDGHWLVLNDCQLLKQWDDEVLAYILKSVSFKNDQSLINPFFRLWLITEENAFHFIPASLQMYALPLVWDSSWDLKEELSFSLQQVLSASRFQPQSAVTADDLEVFFRCAIFHSVLLQRQAYRYSNSGKYYHWSQNDLLALRDAYICIAKSCPDRIKVLEYIAVNLIHGGHVLHSADLGAIEQTAMSCFGTESDLQSKGPHELAKLIDNGHFDLSRPVDIFESCFRNSANNYHVLLGFGEDVSSESHGIHSQTLNYLLQASQTSLGQMKILRLKQKQQVYKADDYEHTKERLQILKKYLTLKSVNSEKVLSNSIQEFLLEEWEGLTVTVSRLLSQLRKPVNSANAASELPSFAELSCLEKRAEYLYSYIWRSGGLDPPGAYRLAAFNNPRGLLVAVMTDAAKTLHKYVSDITLDFWVLPPHMRPGVFPTGSVYLCGLKLKGASWDLDLGALQETDSPLEFSMPLICLKPRFRSPESIVDTFPSHCSYFLSKGNAQAVKFSEPCPTKMPVYNCPLYISTKQDNEDFELNKISVIFKVPLHTSLSPVLCGLRAVRLVSTL